MIQDDSNSSSDPFESASEIQRKRKKKMKKKEAAVAEPLHRMTNPQKEGQEPWGCPKKASIISKPGFEVR